MMKQIFLPLLAIIIFISGCDSNENSFYSSEDAIGKQVKKIEGQFSVNAKYKMISIVYEPQIGNLISVIVKQKPESKLLENWTYVSSGASLKRKGFQVPLGKIGSWSKTSEQFEQQNNMQYFKFDEVAWDKIPEWTDRAIAEMKKLGVANPEVDVITIMNFGSGLVALIRIETMGGGSFVNYEFNMEGKLTNVYD